MDEAAPRALADSWMKALDDQRVVAALEGIYAAASDAVAQRRPACWASGRCCHFRRSGHRLYVTGLETAYCLANRSACDGWSRATAEARSGITVRGLPPPEPEYAPLPTGRGLDADIAAAAARGGCPFQARNLCGVHPFRPLGCRVYFCDRSAQDWQHELSERLLREVRDLHDRFGLTYRYGEWLAMLSMFGA